MSDDVVRERRSPKKKIGLRIHVGRTKTKADTVKSPSSDVSNSRMDSFPSSYNKGVQQTNAELEMDLEKRSRTKSDSIQDPPKKGTNFNEIRGKFTKKTSKTTNTPALSLNKSKSNFDPVTQQARTKNVSLNIHRNAHPDNVRRHSSFSETVMKSSNESKQNDQSTSAATRPKRSAKQSEENVTLNPSKQLRQITLDSSRVSKLSKTSDKVSKIEVCKTDDTSCQDYEVLKLKPSGSRKIETVDLEDEDSLDSASVQSKCSTSETESEVGLCDFESDSDAPKDDTEMDIIEDKCDDSRSGSSPKNNHEEDSNDDIEELEHKAENKETAREDSAKDAKELEVLVLDDDSSDETDVNSPEVVNLEESPMKNPNRQECEKNQESQNKKRARRKSYTSKYDESPLETKRSKHETFDYENTEDAKTKALSISTASREDDSNDTSSLASPALSDASKERSRSRTFHRKKPFGSGKRKHISKRSGTGTSEDGSEERAKLPLPRRPGIVYEIGAKLEAMDFQKKWYLAKIVEIDETAGEILIHFDGWSSRYDEWVQMDSKKLRPTTHPTTRKDTKDKTVKANLVYKPGESILARWTDAKMYPATVKEILPENYFVVIFYDGFTKKLPCTAIAKLPPGKEKLNFSPPPSQVKQAKEIKTEARPSVVDPPKLPLPPIIATKAFTIEEDHNQFKCEVKDCNKSFRKESLLNSHVKHYHGSLKGRGGGRNRGTVGPIRRIKREKPDHSLSKGSSEESSSLPAKLDQKNSVKDEVSNDSQGTGEKSNITTMPVVKPEVEVLAEDYKATATLIKSETTPNEIVEPPKDSFCPDLSALSSPVKSEVVKSETPKKSIPETLGSPLPKTFPVKMTYPITKMETRHAKLCYYKDDSMYTSYKSVALGHQNTRAPQGSKIEKLKSPKEPVKESRGPRVVKAEEGRGRTKSLQETTGKGSETKAAVTTSSRRGYTKRKADMSLQAIKEKSEAIKRLKLEAELEEDVMEIKRQMPQPMPRKRTERISECTTASTKVEDTMDDLTETTDASMGTIDDVDELVDDEVVHCVCENNEENGLMIQCEICLTWQHGSCFSIEELDQVPEKYTCYACLKPRGLRDSFKNRPDYDWFKDGEVPYFQCFSDKPLPLAKSTAVQRTHSLMGSMLDFQNVLHSMRHKMNVLKSGSTEHTDLRNFSNPWRSLNPASKEIPKLPKLSAGLSLDADETECVLNALEKEGLNNKVMLNRTPAYSPMKGFTSLDHSYFSVVKDDGSLPLVTTNHELNFSCSGIQNALTKKPVNESQLVLACSSTDSTSTTTTVTTTEDTDPVLEGLDYSSLPDSVVLDHGYHADDLSDTENELKIVEETIAVQTRGGPGRRGEGRGMFRNRRRGHRRAAPPDRLVPVKVEKLANPEACRRNLAVHILDAQSDLASKLDLIEQELAILESEYETEGSQQTTKSDDDVPKLLQSLKNYSEELAVIQKFAVR